MKKARKKTTRSRQRAVNEIRREYDFTGGVRGKYAARYREGTNVIVLDPDVAREFRTARQVNRTLRAVLKATGRRRTV